MCCARAVQHGWGEQLQGTPLMLPLPQVQHLAKRGWEFLKKTLFCGVRHSFLQCTAVQTCAGA